MKILLVAIFFAYFINTLYGKPPPIITPDDNDVITRQKRELLIPGIPRAHHASQHRSRRSIIHSPEYSQLNGEESSDPEEPEYTYQRSFGPRHPNVLAAGERKKEEEVGLTPAEELALLIEEELVEQEPPKSIFRERQRLLRTGNRQTRQRLNLPDGNPSYGSIFRERQRTLSGKSGQGLDLPAFKEYKRGDESTNDLIKAVLDSYIEHNPQLTDEEKESLKEYLRTLADSEDFDKRSPARVRVLGGNRSGTGSYNSRYGGRRQGRSVSANTDIDDLPQALEFTDNGGHVSKYFEAEKDNLAMRKRYVLNHFKDFAPKRQNQTPNGSHHDDITDNKPTPTAPQAVTTSTSISA